MTETRLIWAPPRLWPRMSWIGLVAGIGGGLVLCCFGVLVTKNRRLLGCCSACCTPARKPKSVREYDLTDCDDSTYEDLVRENYYLLRTIKDILERRQGESFSIQATGGEAKKGSIPMMPATPLPQESIV